MHTCFEICLRGVLYLPSHLPLCASMNQMKLFSLFSLFSLIYSKFFSVCAVSGSSFPYHSFQFMYSVGHEFFKKSKYFVSHSIAGLYCSFIHCFFSDKKTYEHFIIKQAHTKPDLAIFIENSIFQLEKVKNLVAI